MADYIDRNEAIAALTEFRDDQTVSKYVSVENCMVARGAIERATKVLESLPAPDVEPVQEWISVEDKLPPYNRDVLVYRPNMAMKILVDTYDGYYGDDDDEWYEGWALYGKDTHGNPAITHWAYLPQPPKGE